MGLTFLFFGAEKKKYAQLRLPETSPIDCACFRKVLRTRTCRNSILKSYYKSQFVTFSRHKVMGLDLADSSPFATSRQRRWRGDHSAPAKHYLVVPHFHACRNVDSQASRETSSHSHSHHRLKDMNVPSAMINNRWSCHRNVCIRGY